MSRRRAASVLGVALVAASACSGTLEDAAGPTPVVAVTQAPADNEQDLELTLDIEQPSTTVDQPTTPSTTPVEPPTTTPAISTPAAGDAPQTDDAGAPMAIYRGYLGTLDPSQIVGPVPDVQPQTIPGVLPYLGIPGTPAANQPVFIKIDNSSRAIPQAGLNDADIVIEEEVEWGITRFAAIFHSRDATVGPVRSGRTTDLNFLPAFGNPAFVYSGANTLTDQLLRNLTNVDNRSAARDGNYWRQTGRRAPSNLFTKSSSFRRSDAAAPAFLHYRDPTSPVDGVASGPLIIEFGSTTARWDWDGSSWVRTQNGKEHRTAAGDRVSAASVVVLWTASVDTGMVDSSGGVVPELIVVGSGPATVLIDGQRVGGQWVKPSLDAPLTLLDNTGQPLGVTPGRTWIELVTQADVVS